MIIYLKNKHTLQVDNFFFKCCIGKNGISKKKMEGDKKTPKGNFEIGNLYFRKDRLEKPETSLKCIEIARFCWHRLAMSQAVARDVLRRNALSASEVPKGET